MEIIPMYTINYVCCTYQTICGAALTLFRHISHVCKYDRERDGKDAGDGNHCEIPPRVDVDQRNWRTRKKHRH